MRRPVLVATALTVLMGAVLTGQERPAGAAQWTRSAARNSGVLASAVLGADFVPLDTVGRGGSTYTAVKVLNLTTVGIVDVRSSSTAPALLTGTVKLDSFLLSTPVTIESCSVVWRGSTCDGTTHAVLPTTVLTAARTVRWQSAAVPPGGRVHLRVTIGGSVANTLTATVVWAPGRGGSDRTGG